MSTSIYFRYGGEVILPYSSLVWIVLTIFTPQLFDFAYWTGFPIPILLIARVATGVGQGKRERERERERIGKGKCALCWGWVTVDHDKLWAGRT